MQAIVLADSQLIHLDLGLMAEVAGTSKNASGLIHKVYQGSFYYDQLSNDSLAYQTFHNEYNVINEVYKGPEIRIPPPPRPTPSLPRERASHFNDSLKSLEKTNRFY